MTKEVFKTIPGYEELYEVSSIGNVISKQNSNCRILKPWVGTNGYLFVKLSIKGKSKVYTVHKIVAMAFLNHISCGHKLVIDHINDIKTDNRVENLRIVSQRENAYKTQNKYTSKYKGVCFSKKSNKWLSRIYLNNINYTLGYFATEHEAHLAYQNALQKHLNNEQSIQTSKKATENICQRPIKKGRLNKTNN